MRSFVLACGCMILFSLTIRADSAIPIKTLTHLKDATVFVKADFGRLRGTGSGFVLKVDGETGYIVTNHHVVHLPPRLGIGQGKVTLVFWSGTRKERSLPASIVASDPFRDLAILKVTGFKGLPKPIRINAKPELIETMGVFMLGFPFGKALSTTRGNPALTVGKGSVSSIRRDERDEVAKVQIDGDLNPGNSGGPVVDDQGRLIGVAVAKIRNTRIGLAIPAQELNQMLNGRVISAHLTPVKVENGVAEIKVEIRLIDPLNRMKKVAIGFVRQDALKVKPRPDKMGRWPALSGSQFINLTLKQQFAAGVLKLNAKDNGVVMFAQQISYVNAQGKTVYTQPGIYRVDFAKIVSVRPKDWKTNPNDPKGKPVNETQFAKTYMVQDLKVTELKLDGRKIVRCLLWDSDGTAFYVLEPDGLVRRIAVDGFKEEVRLDADSKCSHLALSKEGLVLTVSGSQEVWLLDPKTLKVKGKIEVGGVRKAVASPLRSKAWATADDTLSVLDLKSAKVLKQYRVQDLGRDVGLRKPAITPDGKYLFAQGGIEMLVRYNLAGAEVKWEESSPRIAQNGQAIEISPDSSMVALVSGGGNYGPLKNHPKIGPYSTYVYKVGNINKAFRAINSGAYPQALGFDPKTGAFYAQKFDKQLLVFSKGGIKKKEYQLAGGTTKQLLAHPQGGKILVLTESKLLFVELPIN